MRLDAAVRQHVATRLDHVARRASRLADWDQVAPPDDMLDSLREFIARARHRRTVLETWGYDAKMTTARGLTALFYGPPGTGKTMVAGVIARELGLELYRVDLSSIMSKWIGETEKNLADVRRRRGRPGPCSCSTRPIPLLEADRGEVHQQSLRQPRGQLPAPAPRLVRGHRAAHPNLGGSLDPAFKRRLSLRLTFPVPRRGAPASPAVARSHVTAPSCPPAPLDLAELARRFPLAGGYIRNCAASGPRSSPPTTAGRWPRSTSCARSTLEYRELGKLSTTGAIA